MKITFLGAVGQVTGSRYLVHDKNTKILVDCGLFQGPRELVKRNWDEFPINARSIDGIVLTHAHIDHTGYIPVMVKNGFNGPIYCSRPTYELCEILLYDSARLQAQEIKRYKNKKNKYKNKDKKEKEFELLYTIEDVERALKMFRIVDYDDEFKIKNFTITLIQAGHILGGSFVVVTDGKARLTFSGDLGRPNQMIMKAPPGLRQTDYLVLDSTYGDRLHETEDYMEILQEAVEHAAANNGKVIIPAFAVGRTQIVLYCLYQLKQQKKIPDIPIFLDSPMGISVPRLFCKFKQEHKLPSAECKNIFSVATFTQTVKESKKINFVNGPAVIIAGSGMAHGGRVLYHFKQHISDENSTILFVGYQGAGTYGRLLSSGAESLRLEGQSYPVYARIKKIGSFSAHADYNEIIEWLSNFEVAPKKIFLTHGEQDSRIALKEKIEKQFDFHVENPNYNDSFDLD